MHTSQDAKFQSLLGFLMRCDQPVELDSGGYGAVSIPAGFSDALRHNKRHNNNGRHTVSIPAGFSDALRRGDKYQKKRFNLVSIPAGFSDALRQCD